MDRINFCRQVRENIAELLKDVANPSNSYDFLTALDAQMPDSKNFLIETPFILDDGLKCLGNKIRLPYPSINILIKNGLTEESMKKHACKPTKFIINAAEDPELGVIHFILITILEKNINIFPVLFQCSSDVLTEPDGRKIVGIDGATIFFGTPESVDFYEPVLLNAFNACITTIAELVEALSVKGIVPKFCENPGKSKGKIPVSADDYHLLHISTGNGGSRPMSFYTKGNGTPVGEHSRRAHDHLDHTKKGAVIKWIDAIVVKKGYPRKISKDYVVQPRGTTNGLDSSNNSTHS